MEKSDSKLDDEELLKKVFTESLESIETFPPNIQKKIETEMDKMKRQYQEYAKQKKSQS